MMKKARINRCDAVQHFVVTTFCVQKKRCIYFQLLLLLLVYYLNSLYVPIQCPRVYALFVDDFCISFFFRFFLLQYRFIRLQRNENE